MSTGTTQVTVHMVASLDGFIEKRDGSVSWFESSDVYEKGVEEENTEEFMKSIGCFVMGSRTYELALKLGWPYGDVPTIVLTHRALPNDRANVQFLAGDLSTLVNERLRPSYRNIWLVGGASLVTDFVRLKLADEIRLSILPILLGGGTRFLDQVGHEQRLHLKDAVARKNGLVELWYEVRRD